MKTEYNIQPANKLLSGLTVKSVRRMTSAELGRLDWYCGTAIEFHGGLVLFSATDAAQNNPGEFCGLTKRGQFFQVFEMDGKDNVQLALK